MAPSIPKNVVITGGARGIGRVLARLLLLWGHRVFLLDMDADELAHAVEKHIPAFLREAAGGVGAEAAAALDTRLGHKVLNLRDTAAVPEAIRAAADFFGGHIDALVNNAGIARAGWPGGKTMEDPSVLDEWKAYMETNLTGPFVVSQACIPYMKAGEGWAAHKAEKAECWSAAATNHEAKKAEGGGQGGAAAPPPSPPPEAQGTGDNNGDSNNNGNNGDNNGNGNNGCVTPRQENGVEGRKSSTVGGGSIINISSFRAKQSQENCEGYASSKAGLLGLTHAMAISGAQWGIRCNAVLPGFIDVRHETREGDDTAARWASDIEDERHRQHPAGRIGVGRDIAEAVEWLMGASFVTGQEIVVDGGISKVKHDAA